MDTFLHDWNSENGIDLPVPIQRRSLGLDNDLVELLWQNGEVVLQTQTNSRKQNQDHTPNSGQPIEKLSSFFHQNDNLPSWVDCSIDDNIDKEFCANILPEISPLDQKGVAMDFASLLSSPRPCFGAFGGERVNNGLEQDRVPECSAKTIGSSNRVVKEGCTRKIGPHCESTETGIPNHIVASSCMGSDTTCWNTGSQSIDTYGRKRKSTDVTKSESRSDATELESGGGDKPTSQKSRRSRVAEVHNLSERRRRDRINEKMRALQELIPHSNKSDKASMLDEAIEYMKSLQLQLQLLWMGSAMAPMMLPGIQPYMSRMGMRVGPIGPPMHPVMQNLMRLSRFPLVDTALSTMPPSANQTQLNHSPVLGSINYQNQIPNMSFPEQYANYMGFLSMANGSQPMNMFNHIADSATLQMNQTITPQTNHKQ